MGSLARHHLLTARANRLANHRLHAACTTLSHEEWMAPRVAFFPSIAATMNHILIVDWYYLDAFEAGGRGVASDEMPCGTMAALADRQREADLRLIRFCEHHDAMEDDDGLSKTISLDRGTRGVFVDRIDRTLAHLFMHDTHHRGQIHAMLSGTSVRPPQLDEFLMATDGPARVQDLVATGMTEADLAP